MKQAKKLIKKHPSLKQELKDLEHDLIENPELGIKLSKNTYKIRLSIKSKGKGKSGGARIISYVVTELGEIYLLTIYDKSDIENVDDATISDLINEVKELYKNEISF